MNKAICIRKYLNFFEKNKLYSYEKEDQHDFDGNLMAEYKIKIPKNSASIFPVRIRAAQWHLGFTVVSISKKAFKYHFREFL